MCTNIEKVRVKTIERIKSHNGDVKSILDSKWQLFVKAAEAGSISAAALALDLPLSVVSRSIAQLEKEFGTRMFRRTGRGVVLTDFGQEVYPRIVALSREAEQLADEMRTRQGIPIGDVRFGMLPSTVPVLAGKLFSEVRKQWPQVRLHLTEGSSVQLEDWLVQGRLDMAILLREEAAKQNELVLERIQLYLVAPSSHPIAKRETIAFEELAALPLVLPSEPHPLRARLALLAHERQLSLVPALEADSIRLQHEIVACGGGFAITAGSLAPHDVRRLAIVRIVRPTLTRIVVLATTTHRPYTLATRSVGNLIQTLAAGAFKSA